jgi:ubiquitin carboxyl-terminal hydrolase 5/13
MEWVFSHMEDPNFNDPLPDPAAATAAAAPAAAAPAAAAAAAVDPEKLSMLTAMGFESEAAEAALTATGGWSMQLFLY